MLLLLLSLPLAAVAFARPLLGLVSLPLLLPDAFNVSVAWAAGAPFVLGVPTPAAADVATTVDDASRVDNALALRVGLLSLPSMLPKLNGKVLGGRLGGGLLFCWLLSLLLMLMF